MEQSTAPGLTLFTFSIPFHCDTYLRLNNWGKGFVLLNGFNLGRYWTTAGPQRTLYVPRNVLRDDNSLLVFETDKIPTHDDEKFIEFVDKPEWV